MVTPQRASTGLRLIEVTESPRVTIRIDGIAPSLNRQWRIGRSGGMYLDPIVALYRDVVSKIVALELRKKGITTPNGLLAVRVTVAMPDWITKERTVRTKDLDNTLKPIIDGLSQGLAIDDSLIWEIRAEKLVSSEPYTEIAIKWLSDLILYEDVKNQLKPQEEITNECI